MNPILCSNCGAEAKRCWKFVWFNCVQFDIRCFLCPIVGIAGGGKMINITQNEYLVGQYETGNCEDLSEIDYLTIKIMNS